MKYSDVSLLEELSLPECAELRSVFRERGCSLGEQVFSPYMEENLVCVVQSGSFRIFLACEDKEFTIAILTAGDIYTSHTGAYVEALEEGTLLITDVQTFQERLMNAPAFTKTMVRVLGHLLKGAFGIIDSLAFRDSSTRLATFLLEVAVEESGILRIRLDMTGEQLAKRLGTSRQTVSTLLSDLVRSGVLEKEARRVYRLVQPARLVEMAG